MDASNYQLLITINIDCDVDQVTNIVQHYVPECLLMVNSDEQILYNLPSRNRNQFDPLFFALEFQKQNFKLKSVKITHPTMGDVYPK